MYAQEATPAATVNPTPTDTIAPTPTNTITPTPDPTPTIIATPTVTLTPTETATPSPTPITITPTPTEIAQPTETGPPSPAEASAKEGGQILDGAATVAPTPAPEPTGHIEAAIVKNANAVSLDLSSTDISGSAVLTTNKPDYAPTDAVVISGTGFLPNHAYTLIISSSDAPAVTFHTEIKTNSSGDFIFTYQLDGNYRPNYSVAVTSGSATLATTTFTDAQSDGGAGAIWTTNSGCGGVNINLYANKSDVFLNGGPAGNGGGLPDGNYYVKITEPGGAILGKSTTTIATVSGGKFIHCYQLSDIVYSSSSTFTVKGYDTTSNSGHEYKVWASKNQDFDGAKTDNFKVNVQPMGTINLTKLVDDQSAAASEWTFNITGPDGYSQTGVTSGTTLVNLPLGTYQATETSTLTGYHFVGSTGSTSDCSIANGTATITLSSNGETASCVFHNTQDVINGTIEIKKVVSPHDTTSYWNFGIYDGIFWDTQKTDGYDSGPINVLPGKYNVVEQTAPGTDGTKYISTVECKNGDTTIATGGPASLVYGQNMFSGQLNLSSGQHIVCTFTNTLKPTVTIDPAMTKIVNGEACGVGNAWDDDGLKVNITNWNSGYKLLGRYFVAGGSFGSWTDLAAAGWGTLTVNGTNATFIAYNTGNSPAGPAGWEVKVVDGANTDISNVSSLNYTINSDSTSQVCGGVELWWYKVQGYKDTNESASPLAASGTWTATVRDTNGTQIGTVLNTNASTVDTFNRSVVYNNIKLPHGTYTLTEAGQDGYQFSWGRCMDSTDAVPFNSTFYYDVGSAAGMQQTFGPDASGLTPDVSPWSTSGVSSAYLNLTAGKRIYCVLYNKPVPGTITVNKILIPNTDSGKFNLHVDEGTVGTGTNVGDGGTTGVISVSSTGTHTVGETAGASTQLINYSTSYSCVDGQTPVANGETTTSSAFSVPAGHNIACTFTNTKLATVTVTKFNDADASGYQNETETELPNWKMTLSDGDAYDKTQTTGDGIGKTVLGQTTFTDVLPGDYTLSEEVKDGWNLTNIYCGNEDGTDTSNEHSVSVSAGDVINCFVGNQQTNLKIYKYDQGAQKLGGATFRVCRDVFDGDPDCFTVTDNQPPDTNTQDGVIEIKGLINGSYTVTETKAPPGYLTDENNGCERSINSETSDVSCSFVNQPAAPVLQITKENFAGGDKHAGDTVLFQITVTNLETSGPSFNTTVTDLPAGGFTYVPGSGTISKNGGPAEPATFIHEYASPGVWNLGTMNPGETFILSYNAVIAGNQQPGLYKDLAYANGEDAAHTTVFATSESDPATTYVGTQVNIVGTAQNGLSHNVVNTVESQVLGASTELPNTGASTFWLFVAFTLITGGISVGALGWFLRRKYA